MKPRFALTLEAMSNSRPPKARLRQLLKFALRALRLRCISQIPVGNPARESSCGESFMAESPHDLKAQLVPDRDEINLFTNVICHEKGV